MTVADFLNLITLVTLAGITWWYAKQTRDIAKATKQQADASLRMAEEMEAQRRVATIPVLGCQVRCSGGNFPPLRVCGKLTNAGSGPALNVRWTLKCSDMDFELAEWKVMEQGATYDHQFNATEDRSFLLSDRSKVNYHFEVLWEDVYGSKFRFKNYLTRENSGLKDGESKLHIPYFSGQEVN